MWVAVAVKGILAAMIVVYCYFNCWLWNSMSTITESDPVGLFDFIVGKSHYLSFMNVLKCVRYMKCCLLIEIFKCLKLSYI